MYWLNCALAESRFVLSSVDAIVALRIAMRAPSLFIVRSMNSHSVNAFDGNKEPVATNTKITNNDFIIFKTD